eukprot:1161732-Pelagomonas_calceolata.AAC.6
MFYRLQARISTGAKSLPRRPFVHTTCKKCLVFQMGIQHYAVHVWLRSRKNQPGSHKSSPQQGKEQAQKSTPAST